METIEQTKDSKPNRVIWGIPVDNELCDSGELQNDSYLLRCPNMEEACAMEHLIMVNDRAIKAANYIGTEGSKCKHW